MSKGSFRFLTLIIAIVMILGIFTLAGSREAYADEEYPAPENVYIDVDPNSTYSSTQHFTSTKLYYDCQNKVFTSTKPTTGNYAYYNPINGELFLFWYRGNAIAIEGPIGKKITISLYGDSVIDSDRQFCIIAEGHTLEITAAEKASLLLKDHYYRVDIDGAAMTNAWDGYNGKNVTISGNAALKIDYSARSRAYGIYTNGNLIIKDNAEVDVNVKFGDYASNWSAAVKVDGNINISTQGRVNFTAAARDFWAGMTGYPVYLGGTFNLSKGATYVSMSSVGENPHICNKTIPKLNFSSSGYYDTEETTKTTAVRFFRSDYEVYDAIPANGYFFPDPSFRAFVADYYDLNHDGWVDLDAVYSEEGFNMEGDRSPYEDDIFDEYDDAYSLKGIENFSLIEYLIWEDGYIKEIDLSQFSDLTLISLNNNYLTSLDTKNNPELVLLSCGLNNLTSLDLSKNTALVTLGCKGNYLTKLNVSPLKELVVLDCRNNKLKSLDVSSNAKLEKLLCGNDLVIDPSAEWPESYVTYNEIKSLDVSKCPKLEYLTCNRNNMVLLDLGSNSNLDRFECYGNSLDGVYISGCPKLINVYNNGTKNTDPQYYVEYVIDTGNFMRIDHGDSVITFGGAPNHYAAFNGASLSLKDKISVNIYLLIPDSVTGWKAKVYYEKDGFKTVKYTYDLKKTASYYSSSSNEYRITFPDVSAKELMHRVLVEVYDSSGNRIMIKDGGSQYIFVDYSAADWANTMIAESGNRPAKTVKLAKALLNYGGEAQKYFDYNTDNNANKAGYLSSEMSTVTANTLKAYAPVMDSNTSAVGQNGISLSLKSETYLNVYFTKDVTVSAANLNGAALKKVKNGDEWVARITGISAKNLGDQYTLTVKYGGKTSTQKYSALSWAYNVLSGSNAKPKPLAKALYLYQQAAVEYFK